jgi:hypothetical protein
MQLGQRDEQPEVALAQDLAARRGPLLVAVLGQQLAAVERHRALAGRHGRLRAGLGRSLLEDVDVDLHAGQGQQPVADAQAARALTAGRVERAAGGEQRLAQVVGRRGRVAIRPQHLGDLLAMHPAIGREREQLHEALGAPQPPRALGYRSVAGDLEAAQQPNAQRAVPHRQADVNDLAGRATPRARRDLTGLRMLRDQASGLTRANSATRSWLPPRTHGARFGRHERFRSDRFAREPAVARSGRARAPTRP